LVNLSYSRVARILSYFPVHFGKLAHKLADRLRVCTVSSNPTHLICFACISGHHCCWAQCASLDALGRSAFSEKNMHCVLFAIHLPPHTQLGLVPLRAHAYTDTHICIHAHIRAHAHGRAHPHALLSHTCSLAHTLDPAWPLCVFDVRGACKDPGCTMQHLRDGALPGALACGELRARMAAMGLQVC